MKTLKTLKKAMSKLKIPKQVWTRRNYPFASLKVGKTITVTESIAHFRSSASRWFRQNGRRYRTWSHETGDGTPAVSLLRMEDLP